MGKGNRLATGIIAVIAAAVLGGCKSNESTVVESVIAIQNTTVTTHCSGGSPAAFLMLNLHADEATSVEAAQRIAGPEKATICLLVHPGGRNISFASESGAFSFDPNRMFSDAGARASLVNLSQIDTTDADAIAEATAAVRDFARTLVDQLDLDARPVIIALHNNSEGRYSAASYLPDSIYADEAEAVFLQPGGDSDDFFFVTERDLFDALRAAGFTVVLQDNTAATDDGSLSVYSAGQDIRYVNVEAQHGRVKEQERMLRALFRVLKADESSAN